jgi:hypothetical protein
MKKTMILLTALFLLVALANAEEIDKGKELCSSIIGDMEISSGVKIPQGIPYNNEVFNIYTGENEAVGHITIEKKEVSSAGCELDENPTYDIFIKDISTIKDISDSENPIDALNKKISDKEIEIKGKSTGKKLKGFFTRIGLKMAGWFN